MNDIELLERAAKAAGIDRRLMPHNIEDWRWNPLTDDGDALRLAVKLRLAIYPDLDGYSGAEEHTSFYLVTVRNEGDHYQCLRRAIVMAAAEIWRTE